LLQAAKDGFVTKFRSVAAEGYTTQGAQVKPLPVDAHSSLRRTALHWAAEMGHVELCYLLLDSNADPNFADKDGGTPLHKACLLSPTHPP